MIISLLERRWWGTTTAKSVGILLGGCCSRAHTITHRTSDELDDLERRRRRRRRQRAWLMVDGMACHRRRRRRRRRALLIYCSIVVAVCSSFPSLLLLSATLITSANQLNWAKEFKSENESTLKVMCWWLLVWKEAQWGKKQSNDEVRMGNNWSKSKADERRRLISSLSLSLSLSPVERLEQMLFVLEKVLAIAADSVALFLFSLSLQFAPFFCRKKNSISHWPSCHNANHHHHHNVTFRLIEIACKKNWMCFNDVPFQCSYCQTFNFFTGRLLWWSSPEHVISTGCS